MLRMAVQVLCDTRRHVAGLIDQRDFNATILARFKSHQCIRGDTLRIALETAPA
jgi:hypothetical protein